MKSWSTIVQAGTIDFDRGYCLLSEHDAAVGRLGKVSAHAA